MTADRRLRIGGWAALLVAIVSPLRIVALWVAVGSSTAFTAPDAWTDSRFLAVDLIRNGGLVGAVAGLDGLFRRFAPERAGRVLVVGLVGAGLALIADGALLAGSPRSGLTVVLTLLGEVLIGSWFVGGALVLLGSGREWARIGWTAALGGVGLIIAGVSAAVGFGGIPGVTGTDLIDWFLLIGLLGIVCLVRLWSYVVRGRLPGPGVV